MQGFGAPWHPSDAIADRDDPPRRKSCAGSVTANSSGCAALVAMVQAADLWKGDNGAGTRWLYVRQHWAYCIAKNDPQALPRASAQVRFSLCR